MVPIVLGLFFRFIFLPSNSTHLTQPLDVAVFGPMKKQWRVELNRYKDWCMANNVRNVTIPKDRYPNLNNLYN
jgi:hypothetical protein